MPAVIAFLGQAAGKLLDWLPAIAAYFTGRAAGKASVVAEAQAEVNTIKAAEDKARAEAPHTVPAVLDELQKGEF